MNQIDAARTSFNALNAPDHWVLMRHGGRVNDSWRVIRSWASTENVNLGHIDAENRFHREYQKIRRGSLVLFMPGGDIRRMSLRSL